MYISTVGGSCCCLSFPSFFFSFLGDGEGEGEIDILFLVVVVVLFRDGDFFR